MMKMNGLLLAVLAAASVLTGGCVVTPEPYYGSVRVAPPPLRHEYPGYAPYADYVWISGYWGWSGNRYEWIPGRWEAPRHGHVWVPHRWERDGDHWRQSGGRWEEDRRPRPAPRIEVQPAPRYERDIPPPRREWGGDSRQAPPPERESRPRYEQHDGGRQPEASRDFRQERGSVQRQESRPAPAMAPAQQPAQMRRDDHSRDERKDDSRAKRRQHGDDH